MQVRAHTTTEYTLMLDDEPALPEELSPLLALKQHPPRIHTLPSPKVSSAAVPALHCAVLMDRKNPITRFRSTCESTHSYSSKHSLFFN